MDPAMCMPDVTKYRSAPKGHVRRSNYTLRRIYYLETTHKPVVSLTRGSGAYQPEARSLAAQLMPPPRRVILWLSPWTTSVVGMNRRPPAL